MLKLTSLCIESILLIGLVDCGYKTASSSLHGVINFQDRLPRPKIIEYRPKIIEYSIRHFLLKYKVFPSAQDGY